MLYKDTLTNPGAQKWLGYFFPEKYGSRRDSYTV